MIYALNMSVTLISVIAVCAVVGVLAVIGVIIAAVRIAGARRENRDDAVSVPKTAPALSMPVRPQIPANAGEQTTAQDEPEVEVVNEGVEEAETEINYLHEELDKLTLELDDDKEEPVEEPVEEAVEEVVEEQPEEPVEEAVEEVVEEQPEEPVEEVVEEVVEEQPEEPVEEVVEEVVEEQPEEPVEEVVEEVVEEQPEEPVEEVVEEQPEEPVEEVVEEVVEEQPEEPVEEAVEEVVEEQPEEPVEEAVEEVVEEQPEEPVEEPVIIPAPVVEEATVTEDEEEAEEADEPEEDEEPVQMDILPETTRVVPEGKILMKVRYNRSYTAKLIQSNDVLKGYYDEVKNELMRYGVSNRISWRHETFRKGRKLLARFAIRGKTLGVYLALDAKDYEDTKYKVEDVSHVKRNADVPALYRIKNDRRNRYVKDLIGTLMEKNGVQAGLPLNENYSVQYPYEEIEPLIDRKLVKLLPWKEFVAGSEVGLIAVSKDNLPPELLMGEVSVAEAEDMFVGADVDALVESSAKYSDRTKKDIVNIDTLGRYFESGETVTVAEIKKRVPGINKRTTYIKVLARGVLDKALTVEADDFSPEAVKMIVLTGGKVIRTKAAK